MKKLPFIVFGIMLLSALFSSVCSYQHARAEITSDINNALSITLAKMPGDVVTADTIRCYRNHLTIAELKDTAGISLRTVRRNDRLETILVAEANCGFLAVFKLSDQKVPFVLLCIGILGMLGSLWYHKEHQPELKGQGLSYGGIVYINEQFVTATGEPLRLTPMQHTLLGMFMQSDNHTLLKQEICQRLWPKKPDASETLYTLIRRIKPVIEANSDLKIESDRGRSYSLKHK